MHKKNESHESQESQESRESLKPLESLESQFLEYFQSKKHTLVQSSNVVPHNDKTLLFTNSGMVQFKKFFSNPTNLPYKTATSMQHCIRAGGKHNDLDDVGMDSYHHTFFKMLGNWSFGDYFKEEAIDFAFDFLINKIGLDINKIYVTYYCGKNLNKENNDALKFTDDETVRIWMKYLPESRILPFSLKDIFWEMGDTGPCGPCTEIHYDCRKEKKEASFYLDKIIDNEDASHYQNEVIENEASHYQNEVIENNESSHFENKNIKKNNIDASFLVNKDDPDVIEIWNIVFIEFYRNQDKSLTPLPKKCIDTGMGLERVVRIIENTASNYTTSIFRNLILCIEDEISYANKIQNENEENKIKNESEENKIQNENEENKIKNESEENKIQNENEENKIKNESEENKIKNESEENKIKNENEENKKENESEENKLKNENEENKIQNENEENKIKNESEENKKENESEDNKLNFKYYRDTYDKNNKNFHFDMSIRVIADHSRTISICINDGVSFSSEGRGYVLRRIMRRAVRFCKEINLENVMHKFVRKAAESLNLKISDDLINSVEEEEKLFLKTLEKGKRIFDSKIENNKLLGKDAFLLYDTFGFPFDLTEIMCKEKNILVSKEEFDFYMNEARLKSKKKDENEEKIDFRGLEKIKNFGVTDDSYKYSVNNMECEIFCILYGNELIYKKSENVNEKIKDNDKSNDIYEKLNDINIEELNDIKELNYIKELKDSKELNDKLNDLKEFNNVKKPNDNLIDSKELNNIKNSNDSKELFINNIDDKYLNYSKKSDLSSNLIDENKIYAILCDKTCFYAECGGQIGDTGIIKIYSENILIGEMNVKDVKDFNGFILHFGTIKLLNFNLVNLKGKMIYNDRSDIMKNHTGTHLLNHTLRHFYGDVIQKGSFVDSLKLRFDFSYSKSFSKEEIKKIEDYMNDLINKKIKVKSLNFKFNEIPKDCIYMKDEKYPDEVRIISIENVSKELCGGTHVKNLSEIKSIRIMSEGSISSNTRRIVCFTGENAIKASKGELHELPLIEKIENAEKLKEEEKRILLHKKEIINGNMLKITNLINDYKKEIKNNYFFKIENNKLKHYISENKLEDICKFIYEVNFEDLKLKNISKELNGIANILDKEKINGCIFYIEDDILYFNFRGLNAIERCEKFCEKLVETNIGGNENCASGKGKFKIKN